MVKIIKNLDISKITIDKLKTPPTNLSSNTNTATNIESFEFEKGDVIKTVFPVFSNILDIVKTINIDYSDVEFDQSTIDYYNNILNHSRISNSIITEEWFLEKIKQLNDEKIPFNDYCDNIQQRTMLLFYLKNVEDNYPNLSFNQQLDIASQIMKYDIANGFDLIHSTPVLKKGKVNTNINFPDAILNIQKYEYEGEYLQYYNENGIKVIVALGEITTDSNGSICSNNTIDESYRENYIRQISRYYCNIMANSEKYSKKFNRQTSKNLKTIFMAPFGDKSFNSTSTGEQWAAYVTGNEPEFSKVSSNMIIDVNQFVGLSEDMYQYMVDSYTHELGHVYAYASEGDGLGIYKDIDLTNWWKEIYNQLPNYVDDSVGPLRSYSMETSREAFAECVAEYYGGVSGIYNPNDLKVIDVTIGGRQMTLYEVMSIILDD
ncbi:MAG: hypothetical protein IJ093_03435 [Bacilli bacterium]|nr:hypothetical protein [Bacilli bacterium]